MNRDEIEGAMRSQIEVMEADARALRSSGDVKQAERYERDAARARRQLEALPARMAAVDKRVDDCLRDLIADLERSLAERGTTPPADGA